MKYSTLALFALLTAMASATTVSVDFYNSIDGANYQGYDTNGVGNIYYKWNPYGGGTLQLASYNSTDSSWRCSASNPAADPTCLINSTVAATKTISLASNSGGITAKPFITWTATKYGVITVNFSYSIAGGNLYLRVTQNNSETGTQLFQQAGAGSGIITRTFPIGNGANNTVELFYDGASASISNLTINGTLDNWMFLSAADESTLAKKFYNVTIANSTNSTTYVVNYDGFNKTFDQLPTGDITLTFKNASCQTGNVIPRQYTWNTDDGELNLTAYLLCDGTTAVYATYSVINQYQQSVLGADVSVARVIGTSNQSIASLTTDSAGSASTYLAALTYYWVTVTKAGYYTTSYYLQSQQGTVSLPIVQINPFTEFDDLFNYVNYTLTPLTLAYPLAQVNLSVQGIQLDYYALNLSLDNGTQLYFQNNTDASGGSINSDAINYTNWTGYLYATVYIGKSGYSQFTYVRTYPLSNGTNSSATLTGVITILQQSDMSMSMKMGIAVFGSFFFAAGGLYAAGASGAGIAFVAAFAFFALVLGFVTETLFYLLVIAVFGAWVVMRGV